MRMHRFRNTFGGWMLLMLLGGAVLSGCHSREKIVYLQGAAEVGEFTPEGSYEARIEPDELISIMVTSSELQLAVPFNLQRPQASMEEGGGGYAANYQDSENLCYRVDKEGNIQFPVFGQLHVAGMTRTELSHYLANRLVENGYIADPIVNVGFENSHFSVLGEVNNPGVKQMRRERVTLFEAIAEAGDLTVFGERDKVRLIRKMGDKEQVVTLDLKDPQVIASPYYFVRNGDVIYVEPSSKRAANREVSNLSNYAISLVSILVTVVSLVVTLIK